MISALEYFLILGFSLFLVMSYNDSKGFTIVVNPSYQYFKHKGVRTWSCILNHPLLTRPLRHL